MRRLTVQGISISVQVAQAAQGVSHLQQRTMRVMAQAPVQFVGGGSQVKHVARGPESFAIFWPQHRATARGQYTTDTVLGE
jgi:hypothetical protein